MLSRWFKRSTRLEHSDRDTRLQAVQALDAEQAADAQETLERLATQEQDHAVRHAVFPWVRNIDILATQLDIPEHQNAAALVIAQRVNAGEKPTCSQHPMVMKARVSQVDSSSISNLLDSISDAGTASELAVNCSQADREQVLASALLSSEAGLSTLLKTSRGRDKFCHRFAREKLDLIKKARAHCASAVERLAELDHSSRKAIANQPSESLELIAHRQRLVKLKTLHDAAKEDLQNAKRALVEAGGEDDVATSPADPWIGADLSIPDPADNPFNDLTEAFNVLGTAISQGAELAATSVRRDELTEQWLAHADKFPPNQTQHTTFERITAQFQKYKNAWQRLETARESTQHAPVELNAEDLTSPDFAQHLQARQRWLKRWRKAIQAIAWPADHSVPQDADTIQATLQRLERETEQLKEHKHATLKRMQDEIKQASIAIDEGHLERGKTHLRTARGLQKQGISEFDKELTSLSAQIAEFNDWQNFATNPKRQDLLNAIQTLADNPIDPADQAARVKTLREQWRALGKPGNRGEFEQQRQFDEFAQRAFEPCKSYFAELADEREQNLTSRIALCDQLDDYLANTDWSQADMQAAEKIMRTARDAWHEYHPCERRALKPVQTRFESLQDQLHSKVKASWDANVKLKEAIVAEAKLLVDNPPADPVASTKALQQRWQQVGRTPRGPDQRLWREFRAHCDEVFEQRNVVKRAEKDALAEKYNQLEAVITAFEQALNDAPISKKTYSEHLANIQNASLDLNVKGALRQRIEKVQSDYQTALSEIARKQAAADLVQWQQWDEQVSQAEANDLSLEPPHAAFSDRLQGKPNKEDLLTLTLEAEIAAEIASPPEDQSQRMALQVAFMNAGKRNLAEQDYRELLYRWCAAGPKHLANEVDVPALRQRFFTAITARLGQ